MINVKLDRSHTMFLNMHNYVVVDDIIIVRENKNHYYTTRIVNNERVEIELDASETKVIENKEEL